MIALRAPPGPDAPAVSGSSPLRRTALGHPGLDVIGVIRRSAPSGSLHRATPNSPSWLEACCRITRGIPSWARTGLWSERSRFRLAGRSADARDGDRRGRWRCVGVFRWASIIEAAVNPVGAPAGRARLLDWCSTWNWSGCACPPPARGWGPFWGPRVVRRTGGCGPVRCFAQEVRALRIGFHVERSTGRCRCSMNPSGAPRWSRARDRAVWSYPRRPCTGWDGLCLTRAARAPRRG